MFAYQTKELRISKQSSYKLIYEREPILVIDYRSHGRSIIERLLEITNKVSQFKKMIKRTIHKA